MKKILLCLFFLLLAYSTYSEDEEVIQYRYEIQVNKPLDLPIYGLQIINIPVTTKSTKNDISNYIKINNSVEIFKAPVYTVDINGDGFIDRLGYRFLAINKTINYSNCVFNASECFEKKPECTVYFDENQVFTGPSITVFNKTSDQALFLGQFTGIPLNASGNIIVKSPETLYSKDILELYWYIYIKNQLMDISYNLCPFSLILNGSHFSELVLNEVDCKKIEGQGNNISCHFEGDTIELPKDRASVTNHEFIVLCNENYSIIITQPGDFYFYFDWVENTPVLAACIISEEYNSKPDLFSDLSLYVVYQNCEGIKKYGTDYEKSNVGQIAMLLQQKIKIINITRNIIANQTIEIVDIYRGSINSMDGLKTVHLKIIIKINSSSPIKAPNFIFFDETIGERHRYADFDNSSSEFILEEDVHPKGNALLFPFDSYVYSFILEPSEFRNESSRLAYDDWTFNAYQEWSNDKLNIVFRRSEMLLEGYILSLVLWYSFCYFINIHLKQCNKKDLKRPKNILDKYSSVVGFFCLLTITPTFIQTSGNYLPSIGGAIFIFPLLFPLITLYNKTKNK